MDDKYAQEDGRVQRYLHRKHLCWGIKIDFTFQFISDITHSVTYPFWRLLPQNMLLRQTSLSSWTSSKLWRLA